MFSDLVIASCSVQAGHDAPPELRTGLPGGRSGNICLSLPSRRAVTLIPFSSAVASTYGFTEEPGWRGVKA